MYNLPKDRELYIHVALRKFCDSPATSVLWNFLQLAPGPIVECMYNRVRRAIDSATDMDQLYSLCQSVWTRDCPLELRQENTRDRWADSTEYLRVKLGMRELNDSGDEHYWIQTWECIGNMLDVDDWEGMLYGSIPDE